ncbi:MAG: flagellar basal body P-ring formation chaperone FlgA [Hyphomicrobiales bacterium]
MAADKTVRTLISIALVCAAFSMALAADLSAEMRPELRSNIEVSGDYVRLGDLFENAGTSADTTVFRAPAPGRSGSISARRLVQAAESNGLQWDNPNGVRDVLIMRRGILISSDEIRELIGKELAERLSTRGTDVTVQIQFAGKAKPLYVPADKMPEAEVTEIRFSRRSGRFAAVVSAPAGDPAARRYTYAGRAVEAREIAVPVRTIRRGSVIRAEDVALRAVPTRRIDSSTVEDTAGLVGMATKRTLRTDQPVRARDLERPKIIAKNAAVTVRYQAPGLMLTMRGKALQAGALGDLIEILNVQSKRTIQGKVIGPNLVSSIGATPRVLAAKN